MKYRACDSCVTSKTRCDDVQPTGCLVCRKRNKACSLAEIASRDVRRISSSTPLVEETNAELRSRLEIVEARSWELEQRIKAMEATPRHVVDHITPGSMSVQAMSTTQGYTPANDRDRNTTESVEIDLYMAQIADQPQRSGFDERIMCPVNRKGYPCAIAKGIVTQDQVDMAFQVFKHRFSSLLPLPPFLLSSTPTPTHPFVVLAFLTHVPGFASQDIHNLVEESLVHASSGGAEDETLLALLILSLQPFRQERLTSWSPVRIIALAYDIGKGKSLESVSRSAVRHKDMLCDKWWIESLDKVLLWEAIKAQYNLIHLGWTAIDDLVDCRAAKLPGHALDRYQETINHLRSCSEFFSVVRPYVQALADANSEIAYSHIDLDSLFKLWSPIPGRADALIKEHPTLQIPVRTSLFTLGLRTTMHVQSIPVPVFPDYKALGNSWIFEQMLRTAFTLIDIFVNMPNHADLPKHSIMIFIVAVSCGLRVMHFYPDPEPDITHVTFKNIPRACAMIANMGGAPAMAFEKLREAFASVTNREEQIVASVRATNPHTVDTQFAPQKELPIDAAAQSFDTNDFAAVFNFDFESWESLLGAYHMQDNLLYHDPQPGWRGVQL